MQSIGSESKPPSSHWPLRSTIIESSSHFSVALKIIRNSGINSICPVAEFFTGICLLLPTRILPLSGVKVQIAS